MTRFIFSTLFSFLLLFSAWGQTGNNYQKAQKSLNERGEVCFQFRINPDQPFREQLEKLTRIVSIDRVENNTIMAYANQKEFNEFLKLNLDYEVLTPPSMLHKPFMLNSKAIRGRNTWDFYPTYQGYVDMMNQFETDYPDLCEVVNIKTLDSGHKLLFIHINDSLGVDQNEPEFMYTSTMHGDEVTGYVLMLHLIDYLLSNYGSDDQATGLVNNIDIWINPLANPDGTYAGGDNTVYGATRFNANGVDLNRNYPDPRAGAHPDGNEYQPETQAFMDFADAHDLVLSCNMHGGAEVCNYPWDTWSKRHPDDAWWIYVCRQYADTVHKYGPSGYMTDLNNGITDGYDWYSITGGRQDYMNYFRHCREFTLELSETKTPPANQLPDFWDYNYRSFLNYMKKSVYGVVGRVTNASNGNPVPARVFVENHDQDNSFVFASMPVGNYNRPIKAGTWDFTFSSFGYYSKTIENVSVSDEDTVLLNVQLQPYVNLHANFYTHDTLVEKGSMADFFDTSTGNSIDQWDWAFEGGNPGTSEDQNPAGILYDSVGTFDVSLTVTDTSGSSNTLLKENYIRVSEFYNMKDTTVYLCEGFFFDTGGKTGNYGDNEDYVMTFISMNDSGSLKATFRAFELEEENDYLEVFDGHDENAPLIGTWSGTDNPGTLIASNNEGALTFRFHSNDTINYSGWMAELSCDTGVGIVQSRSLPFSVYPNPASGKLIIHSQVPVSQISIFDVNGRMVYQSQPSSQTMTIGLTGWKKGLYILHLKTDGRVYNQKLIIR